jgi:hypothetical protein
MKSSKIVGAVAVILFVLPTTLIQPLAADVTAVANAPINEKLPAFMGEVIGINLTKYNITNEGYGESYPPEFGGQVKREQGILTLEESNTSEISVAAMFDNGSVSWLHFYPISGPMMYTTQPSTDALVESRNILQRYQVFCQKYGINSSHITTELSMFNSLPASPPASGSSSNLNQMSDFTPATITSGNMKLTVSQTGIGACYTTGGVDVPNKSVGMAFGDNTFVFSDRWNLYNIGSLSIISKDEATSIAFEAAKKYTATLQIGTSKEPTPISPEWSTRMDVGLDMVQGQLHNTSAIGAPQTMNLGNTTREPLSLYPLWQAIFYFTEPISNIAGIQVNVWGDTKEIAYCGTYGYLGDIDPTPSSEASSSPSPSTNNTETPPPTPTVQPSDQLSASSPTVQPSEPSPSPENTVPTSPPTGGSMMPSPTPNNQPSMSLLPAAVASVAVIAVVLITAALLVKRKRA